MQNWGVIWKQIVLIIMFIRWKVEYLEVLLWNRIKKLESFIDLYLDRLWHCVVLLSNSFARTLTLVKRQRTIVNVVVSNLLGRHRVKLQNASFEALSNNLEIFLSFLISWFFRNEYPKHVLWAYLLVVLIVRLFNCFYFA